MKINISEIETTPSGQKNIDFSEIYDEFNKDIPVTAKLSAELQGSLVKITGNINAKIKLVCDYCLEEFTKDFNIDVEEYYERENVNISSEKEFEIKDGNFIQDLNGNDEIDITDFVYQILILNIPNRIVCGINCKGKENLEKYLNKDSIDPRLEVFKNIKTDKE